ncbi:MAG: AAA family ATPase, partial [Planctomycetota bacterium]|nr:AAA family ATPase [Planctomycetota bacterium]
MRLAKLTLSGFKSFADRTEFTFDAPITGIVGPNGCGKSNVVDAIKWVLGERSAKSLRGKEMTDVIFSGSAGRPPLGLASVVLTFDNPELTENELALLAHREEPAPAAHDHEADELEDPAVAEAASIIERGAARRRALPVDSDTVDVERRLFRDGTSQYLINGKRARLRDIRDLFLDTGVGADAYSIIEQGKVDALLLANPYERRTFFEEAAGVARFKVRRVEAQRKLERSETNLIRVREQLESTDRRLRIVRGQAAKARKFLQLDAELRALRACVAFEQYADLRSRLEGLTSRLQELETQRVSSAQEVTALEAEKTAADDARHAELDRQRASEREKAAAEHRLSSAHQRAAMTERAAADARRQLAEGAERLASAESQLTTLAADIDRHDALVAELSEAAQRAEQALASLAAARETAQASLADKRLTLAQRRAAAVNIDRELAALAARLDADQRRLHALADQKQRLENRLAALDRDSEAAAQLRAAAEKDIAARRSRLAQLETQIATLVSSAQLLSGDQRALSSRLSEQEQRRARIDSRRATLQEMADTRAGVADAVRDVLERAAAALPESAAEATLFSRVRGVLAERIEVSAADAPAVEAALGSLVQAVLVTSVGDLLARPELAALAGRVTFLPLEG